MGLWQLFVHPFLLAFGVSVDVFQAILDYALSLVPELCLFWHGRDCCGRVLTSTIHVEVEIPDIRTYWLVGLVGHAGECLLDSGC